MGSGWTGIGGAMLLAACCATPVLAKPSAYPDYPPDRSRESIVAWLRQTDLDPASVIGVSDDALRDLITSVWHARTDRGAENRLELRERSPLIPLKALKRDPHLEMHAPGG